MINFSDATKKKIKVVKGQFKGGWFQMATQDSKSQEPDKTEKIYELNNDGKANITLDIGENENGFSLTVR